MKNLFPDRIAIARKNKKMTQEDVAGLLKITRPAYTAYESGRRQPDYETLIKLANLFGVSTDYLLGRTDNPEGILDKSAVTDLEQFFNRENIKFGGEPIVKEDKENLLDFIRLAMKTIKQKNK